MTYEKATAELVQFDNSDVIATSGVCSNVGIGCVSNVDVIGCNQPGGF